MRILIIDISPEEQIKDLQALLDRGMTFNGKPFSDIRIKSIKSKIKRLSS